MRSAEPHSLRQDYLPRRISQLRGLLKTAKGECQNEASHHDVPAVRIERRAHIVGPLVRGEENGGRRDLFHGAGAADRQLGELPLSPRLWDPPKSSVSIGPGQIAFTVTPSRATS